MGWRIVASLFAVSVLGACSPQVVIVSDQAAPALDHRAPSSSPHLSTFKIFADRDHVDAGIMAHAVATLVAGGDSAIVPGYLVEVERETGCRAWALSGTAPEGEGSRVRLARERDQELAILREDAAITSLGDAMLPVTVPFKMRDPWGRVVDAGWVGIIVYVKCVTPSIQDPPTPGGSLG